MKSSAFAIAFACTIGLVSASSSSAFAQAEMLIVNASGGNEGAYSSPRGEYTLAINKGCRQLFYISRRSQTRFEAHFSRNARLVRRSDNAVICRW